MVDVVECCVGVAVDVVVGVTVDVVEVKWLWF